MTQSTIEKSRCLGDVRVGSLVDWLVGYLVRLLKSTSINEVGLGG